VWVNVHAGSLVLVVTTPSPLLRPRAAAGPSLQQRAARRRHGLRFRQHGDDPVPIHDPR
ncbi:Hypothetical predicted protein, partial [Marmota monax]